MMSDLFGGQYYDLECGYSGGGTGGPSSAIINTLLNSTYGGHWSSETGITKFESDAEAFLIGCIYFETNNYWGNIQGMATNFIDACSRYSKIKFLQNLTASLYGGGALEHSKPWMDIAIAEIGQTELIYDPKDPTKKIINPRVQKYFTDGGFSGDPLTTAWCAIFVNYCLNNAGIKGNGSWTASDFNDWGVEVDHPCFGAIAVYSHHVGFVIGTKGRNIWLLGGNQGGDRSGNLGDMVCLSSWKTSKHYRYPTMYTPNFWTW
jgi:uncharacterized protein (TIGR02594 family)